MASTRNSELESLARVQLPRITIKYCTQCKWMLRAAYVGTFFSLRTSNSLHTSSHSSVAWKYRVVCVQVNYLFRESVPHLASLPLAALHLLLPSPRLLPTIIALRYFLSVSINTPPYSTLIVTSLIFLFIPTYY